jgi:hypothetical protein
VVRSGEAICNASPDRYSIINNLHSAVFFVCSLFALCLLFALCSLLFALCAQRPWEDPGKTALPAGTSATEGGTRAFAQQLGLRSSWIAFPVRMRMTNTLAEVSL